MLIIGWLRNLRTTDNKDLSWLVITIYDDDGPRLIINGHTSKEVVTQEQVYQLAKMLGKELIEDKIHAPGIGHSY